jgi:hypothetical protein
MLCVSHIQILNNKWYMTLFVFNINFWSCVWYETLLRHKDLAVITSALHEENPRIESQIGV